MNGAVMLQSWTSSISVGSTASTVWIQLLVSCRSGTRPPASIASPTATRSIEAEFALKAIAVSACGVGAQCWPDSIPAGSDVGRALATWPKVTSRGSSPGGSGARSASTSGAYASGERRTVCAALLMRMSSGPSSATASASAITCDGSRRSMPTTLSRPIHSSLSSIALKRRIASFGKRVVIVVCAPSRSSRSAMYMPIFARPPVSSARRPVRSVRASRRWWFLAAQLGQSWWYQ